MKKLAFVSSQPLQTYPVLTTHKRLVTPVRQRNPQHVTASLDAPDRSRPVHKFSKALAALAAAISITIPIPADAAKVSNSFSLKTYAATSSKIHRNIQSFNGVQLSVAVKPMKGYAMVSVPKTQRFTIADRVSFWTGEFLMWNPGAKVLALFGATLLCMYFGSFLYKAADPEGNEAQYPFWHAVRAIANPLEDDWTKNSLRTTSIALASIGMVVFAILVGMVTESVESAVQNADGEMSRVVVSDHILICGWSNQISQILKDINSVSPKTKVVVLANPIEKDRMKEELKEMLSDEQRKNLRVYYRPGAPIIEQDLSRVAAGRAKKILLVNSRSGDPIDNDRLVLSRALAIRQNLPSFTGDIVAELNNVRDERILRSILSSANAKSVETVNAERLLFRFMAQAIRQPGLADVVAQLMGGDARKVFHVGKAKDVAPQLIGMNYSDVRPTSVPGSIVCGHFDNYGKVRINTSSSMTSKGVTITPETQLLLLGVDNSSNSATTKKSNLRVAASSRLLKRGFSVANTKELKRESENYLICGWRRDMNEMLRELDGIIASGSKITILDEDAPDAVSLGLKNITVTCVQKRADMYENLEELLNTKTKPYDHVVLLGSAIGDDAALKSSLGREEDTKTLASMMYVNELLSRQEQAQKNQGYKPTMVTVEFINERVADMAKEQENIANAILPQNLSAKIAAQTVRDSRLNVVWRELLSQEGREVYLRPCTSYKEVTDERMSFAKIAEKIGRTKDDIVIGYIPRDGVVVINPSDDQKVSTRVWDPNDILIVLSEE